MLLGEPPFTVPTTQAIVAKVLTERPASIVSRRSTVPMAIDRAIQAALQKFPADRYSSAGAFSAALAGSEAETIARTQQTGRTLQSGDYRLTEDACRRLDRTSFDPRLIGSAIQYLDNGVEADVLVCTGSADQRMSSGFRVHRIRRPILPSFRFLLLDPRALDVGIVFVGLDAFAIASSSSSATWN